MTKLTNFWNKGWIGWLIEEEDKKGRGRKWRKKKKNGEEKKRKWRRKILGFGRGGWDGVEKKGILGIKCINLKKKIEKEVDVFKISSIIKGDYICICPFNEILPMDKQIIIFNDDKSVVYNIFCISFPIFGVWRNRCYKWCSML